MMAMDFQDSKDRRGILVFQDILDFRVNWALKAQTEVLVLKAAEEEGAMLVGRDHQEILAVGG